MTRRMLLLLLWALPAAAQPIVLDCVTKLPTNTPTITPTPTATPISGAAPALVGFVPGVAAATGVTLAGSTVWVSSNQFGLASVAVTPTPPSAVAIGATNLPFKAQCVGADGALAITGDPNTNSIRVFTIINPQAPTQVGTLSLGGNIATKCAIVGNFAYLDTSLSGGGNELDVVDLSTPSAPHKTGSVLLGGPGNIRAIGTLVYVAAGSAGLQIVDVSNSAFPQIRSTTATTGGAKDVDVAGAIAYVGTTTNVQTFNVSNPNAPVGLGTTPTVGNAVAISGNTLAVLDGSQFKTVDVTNPATPNVLFTGTNFGAVEVAASGVYAYLASTSNGLNVMNISNPLAPVLAANVDGRFPTGGNAGGVGTSGRRAALCGFAAGMKVLDVATAAACTSTGVPFACCTGVGTGCPPTASVLGVLAAPASSTINKVVFSSPTTAFAFLSGPSGFTLNTVDLTNPAAPAFVGGASVVLAGTGNIRLVGSLVYAAGGGKLQIVNEANPAAPVILSTTSTSTGSARDVVVNASANIAYVAVTSGIQMFNVANPASPVSLGTVAVNANALALAPPRLYSIDATNLYALDATTPAAPMPQSTTASFGAGAVEATGNFALLAVGALNHGNPELGGVYVINMATLASPTLRGQVTVAGTIPGVTGSIAIGAGNLAMVADQSALVDVVRP